MRKNAFTLIEMMVVVAIIGLLTATAVLGFGRQRATARETRRIQDVSSISDALQQRLALSSSIPDASNFTAVNSGLLDFLVTDGLLNSIPDEQNPAAHTDGQPWCEHYAYWSVPTTNLGNDWGMEFKGVKLGSNTYLIAFAAEFTGSAAPQNVHPLNNNVIARPTKDLCNWNRGLGIVYGTSK